MKKKKKKKYNKTKQKTTHKTNNYNINKVPIFFPNCLLKKKKKKKKKQAENVPKFCTFGCCLKSVKKFKKKKKRKIEIWWTNLTYSEVQFEGKATILFVESIVNQNSVC